jgi:hypothetical protein
MRKRSRKAETEDINQGAFRIVRDSTGEPDLSNEDARRALAQALGRLGGLKGGKARAAKLSKAQRSASASKAARARWDKRHDQP